MRTTSATLALATILILAGCSQTSPSSAGSAAATATGSGPAAAATSSSGGGGQSEAGQQGRSGAYGFHDAPVCECECDTKGITFWWERTMGMLPHRGLKEGSRSLGRDRLAVASAR